MMVKVIGLGEQQTLSGRQMCGTGGLVSSCRTWYSAGVKIITVTARNVGCVVNDVHVIATGARYSIYLPLILRQSR